MIDALQDSGNSAITSFRLGNYRGENSPIQAEGREHSPGEMDMYTGGLAGITSSEADEVGMQDLCGTLGRVLQSIAWP